MGLIRRRRRHVEENDRVTADGFGGGDVRIVGRSSPEDDAPPRDDSDELADTLDPDDFDSDADDFGGDATDGFGTDVTTADEAVLDELSQAFDPDAAHSGSHTADADGVGSASRHSGSVGSSAARHSSGGQVTTIAIGGEDDLPDAVYLDEERELGDEGTVFIDDDGHGDAILPQDATGPGIEPRLRQRRIGVRRSEGRRRLKWAAVVLVIAVVVTGGLAVLGSSLFSIDAVEVSGRQYADEEVVQSVVDDLAGTPVLLADTEAAERRLEQIAWVEEARVRTDFPGAATIELRERVPLATIRGSDGRYRVLDREGRVLAIEDGQPLAPALISGPGTLDLDVGQFADIGYAAAATLVPKLTPTVRSRLESISATADGSDIRLLLRNDPVGGDEAASEEAASEETVPDDAAEEPAPDAASEATVPDDASEQVVAEESSIEVRLGAAIGDNEQIERLVRLERLLDDVAGADTRVIDVSTDEATER